MTNVSKITAPLNRKLLKDLLKTLGPFSEEEKIAVNKLKAALKNLPVLTLSSPQGHYTFDTNALNTQSVYVLLQEYPDGNELPIG